MRIGSQSKLSMTISLLMRQELPVTLEEARDNCLKDYPHTKEQVAKNIDFKA